MMQCPRIFLYALCIVSFLSAWSRGEELDGFGLEIALEGDTSDAERQTIAVASINKLHIFWRAAAKEDRQPPVSNVTNLHDTNVLPWNKVQEFDHMGYDSPVVTFGPSVFKGDDEGVVHVFTAPIRSEVRADNIHPKNTWNHETIVPKRNQRFGSNLMALDEDTVVLRSIISKSQDEEEHTQLLVYQRQGKRGKFQQVQELDLGPPGRYEFDSGIARSMAASGDKLVLGGGTHLYLFVKKTRHNGSTWWTKTDKISTRLLTDMTRSISIDGNTVAVGYSPPIYPFGQGGSVTIFDIQKERFHKKQIITGLFSSFFGLSVALHKDDLVIGAPEEVYVYQRRSRGGHRFERKQMLTAANTKKGEMNLFGQNVAVQDNTILVGAYLKDGPGGGSAYVFSRKEPGSKWMHEQELKGEGDVVLGIQ
uniref:Uncharacterized protein n=1 Tax=Entomoneis paludosa TaxID=265537 RepID=A0A7S2YGL0_9STRA|mmetsp:Transcript_31852/g.66470  ORF Transcript_31852/g.66470 Transcript_31852/m.66470 type:complete len:421 (+) Transcript_31852:16-1278(+)